MPACTWRPSSIGLFEHSTQGGQTVEPLKRHTQKQTTIGDAMNKLSAFADEISSDLDEQISALKENGVDNIELRGVWGTNVVNLSRDQIDVIRQKAQDNGIGFSSIGSPIGKFPLDGDFNEELDRVKLCLEYADLLDAPFIRMFSYRIPDGENASDYRTQVLDWICQLVTEAEKTEVRLAHENEKNIYGETNDRCLDLFESINSPAFTGIFDFSNFVQAGHRPYDECWVKLKKHTSYFHIKDCSRATGKVVPSGQGDGDMQQILAEANADGFDGYLSLEPHLPQDNPDYGSTGAERFKTATDALKEVLRSIDGATIE